MKCLLEIYPVVPRLLKVGDIIIVDKGKNMESEYIIGSASPSSLILIELSTGTRKTEAVEVQDFRRITNDEMSKLLGMHSFEDAYLMERS